MAYNTYKYTITPERFVRDSGWSYSKTDKFLVMRSCPFCEGGQRRDTGTFIIHKTDGNFKCVRQKCEVKGTFWELLKSAGLDPKQLLDRERCDFNNSIRPKSYVYGK